MYPNQPVSMIEPVGIQQPVKKARNKTLIIVIVACAVFLVALAVVLIVFVRGGGSAGYNVDYKKAYVCAVDEYEYLSDNPELSIEIKDDNTYRMGLLDDEYSIGTWKQTDLTRAQSEDGANEVNYYLTLRHEKDFIDNVETTEETGYENAYVFNFNEKSDVVVITDKESEAIYYCKVE